MSNAVLTPSRPPVLPGVRLAVAAVIAAWLATVLLLGAARAFDAPPGSPPIGIALGVLLPLAAFFVAFRLAPPFRQWVLSLDPRVSTAIQAWRLGGLDFLSLYAYGVLPAAFALPAGFGDMAIALAAPWMLARLLRSPDFAAQRTFIAWNLLGVLDLVVAVVLGALGAVLATGAAGEVSTAPMARLPLLLIPGFLVPLFLMLHATALLQARALRARW